MSARRVLGNCVLMLLLSVAGFGAGRSDVADAAMKADKEAVRSLLKQQADVNAAQADGATALHWAAHWNDLEMAELLIRGGANAKAANRLGATPLFLATVNGSAAMVAKLLEAGANPNEVFLSNGETPLMMASRTGDVSTVEVLLKHGADVNAKESFRGTTALMWAADEGHADVIRMLAAHGADVNARSTIARSTTRARANPAARPRPGAQAAQRNRGGRPTAAGSQNSIVADARNAGGLTALVCAVRQGDQESVKALLAAGADVNEITADGNTPLLVAIRNGHYELSVFLLNNGADPDMADANGFNPLFQAVHFRNIEKSYSIPMWTGDNLDPLELIKKLLEMGADPDVQINAQVPARSNRETSWLKTPGATAFVRAAVSGDITVMRLLLAHGADPFIPTNDKTTALMAAAGLGWLDGLTQERSEAETLEAVKLLVLLESDVNAVNDDGRTALHGAAHKGVNAVVQFLVDAGARMDIKDNGSYDASDRLLPLDWAEGVRVTTNAPIPHPQTAELLRQLMRAAGIPTETSTECARTGFGCAGRDPHTPPPSK